MSTEVLVWWFFLCLVSTLNVLALTYSARTLWHKQGKIPSDVYASRRLQLILSAGYVLGCAFRSALPVYDIQRICLFDSWLSSVIVGRSVATVAELCFVTQWALLLHEVSLVTQIRASRMAAIAVLPLIAIAESCSWYSVLTTSNLGHVFEETLWGIAATILVASLLSLWSRASNELRPLLLCMCLTGAVYVIFMFMVDVPMYWTRWNFDESHGRHYLSIAQGLSDTAVRWQESHNWQVWRGEVLWMSLYFSIAVWLSIACIHTPALKRHKNGEIRIHN